MIRPTMEVRESYFHGPTRIHHELRGYHSGKVGAGMCGPDGAHLRPLRFTNGPFLFENWFRSWTYYINIC